MAPSAIYTNIPPELVVNADQTGIMLVPVGKRTYARLGAKAIRLLGIDDKRQICMCFYSCFFFVKCLRSQDSFIIFVASCQVTVVAAAVADSAFLI